VLEEGVGAHDAALAEGAGHQHARRPRVRLRARGTCARTHQGAVGAQLDDEDALGGGHLERDLGEPVDQAADPTLAREGADAGQGGFPRAAMTPFAR
jgi:hypothetical protein